MDNPQQQARTVRLTMLRKKVVETFRQHGANVEEVGSVLAGLTPDESLRLFGPSGLSAETPLCKGRKDFPLYSPERCAKCGGRKELAIRGDEAVGFKGCA